MTSSTNPFRFGDLALDEAFTDRADELAELCTDMRNGQNVALIAPRRYGKSSLLRRAEQELVAGYHTEYSGMRFGLFQMGEYVNMITLSALAVTLFFGGWYGPWAPLGPLWFILKICLCLFGFLWVRATFPRFRYDQLMRLGWKVFLPLSLGWLVLTAGVLLAMGWLPGSPAA